MNRDHVIEKVSSLTRWWIRQRVAKIGQTEHASMEINPFLAPLICSLHGLKDARQLADFVTAGHFYIGHGTGFGKLIDEKILPEAFGTHKLSKAYRQQHGLMDPAYDDIDHIVIKAGGKYLLSQKASKWTIQLGQAMGLNRSFKTLIDMRNAGAADFDKIVVGVFYGHSDDLTDKYRILQGIVTGAAHDVIDISDHVEVHAGRAFWTWLASAADAQEWVMSGIMDAIRHEANEERQARADVAEIERELTGMFSKVGDVRTEADWIRFIDAINR